MCSSLFSGECDKLPSYGNETFMDWYKLWREYRQRLLKGFENIICGDSRPKSVPCVDKYIVQLEVEIIGERKRRRLDARYGHIKSVWPSVYRRRRCESLD